MSVVHKKLTLEPQSFVTDTMKCLPDEDQSSKHKRILDFQAPRWSIPAWSFGSSGKSASRVKPSGGCWSRGDRPPIGLRDRTLIRDAPAQPGAHGFVTVIAQV